MANFKFRRAVNEDLLEISRIEEGTFPNPYPHFLMERLIQDFPETFLVASDQSGGIAGYCVSSVEGTSAHLISIAVVKNLRRKGIATELLKNQLVLLEGHGVQELWLEVSTKNREAIDLYLKLGFSKTGVVEHYYSDGSAALKMRLVIPGAVQKERGLK